MSTLAKNGNRVLFIENTGVRAPRFRDMPRIKSRIKNWFRGINGIREQAQNLYIFSPLVLPFPYLRLAKWINRHLTLSVLEKWTKVMHFTDPVVWTFLPTPLSLDIIDSLSARIIIYYCIDSFQASSEAAKKIKKSEEILLRKADLVFVTSRELYDYCSRYNNKTYIFPFAVNFQEFEKARANKDYIPQGLKDIKKPVIGYIGGVHKWIDFALVKKAAQYYPQYSFVFVGPAQTDVSSLSGIKNIYFLGQKDHREIPYFINNFDVCIIPYLLTEYTNNVYPAKLNEYHALGKPVLSTNLPEIANFNRENHNLVSVAKNPSEFIEQISLALKNNSDTLINQRISSAKKNSWSNKIEEMAKLAENAIEEKSKVAFDWQKSLSRLYRVARRKTLKLALVILSAYLLVFYTPLIWFLANPLKIVQEPQKADCIVVFAGGVGESGQPGQGYEERVQYAADLYKQGYAKNLIFSSGSTYVFAETLIMKALALSLGVPESAIILEDKASNTYENVKFSRDILHKNHWDKILLVSSMYNMRRASLVFNKIAGGIKVRYAPIPKSRFYSHQETTSGIKIIHKQISLRQIKGIFHEYLGILYYLSKGWI